ncbi:MAG: NAD(+)/NADH kinase [Acetatifactor sp.]|nr:NAD(+)/NADH kinase [Acetatifactor sp.]
MKHFLIYTNQMKDKEYQITGEVKRLLEEKGQQVTLFSELKSGEIPVHMDAMLVLGGDGTVLQAVRETKTEPIPLIGINLGTLGFLAQIEPAGIEEALDRLIAGDYTREERMMLQGQAVFADGSVREGFALNDIVITRNGPLQMLKLNIYVNGRFLHQYQADGVIVTTPTGSTGYSLSAGGPLIAPGAKLLMLTPICPHTLNQRSIIFSSEDVIEIEIPQGRDGQMQRVSASFDGVTSAYITTGERIRIRKSEQCAEFILMNQESFLDVLNRKMSE